MLWDKEKLNWGRHYLSHENVLIGASHAVCVHRDTLANARYQLPDADTPRTTFTSIFILPLFCRNLSREKGYRAENGTSPRGCHPGFWPSFVSALQWQCLSVSASSSMCTQFTKMTQTIFSDASFKGCRNLSYTSQNNGWSMREERIAFSGLKARHHSLKPRKGYIEVC